LGEGMIGAMFGVLLLVKVNLLAFIHLYAGDYLASEALVMAVVLVLFNRAAIRNAFSARPRPLVVAGALAFVSLLAFGAWFNWEISDLWLDAPRWLRFAELLPFACVFLFVEQAILGPVGSGKRRLVRFAVFLALRFEIWLACVIAFFVLASGQILLPILVMQFGIFSAAQGLVSDALRLRTGSATAAALFGAILTAWFVAAVFPIT
ncbi:MAG TPA: hypothetical protein VJS43_10105, partial [Candidatus Acidoferrales bacterium]|nr:hypothetical protein [Candidatus Acidoferrales bacterium]